MRNESLTRGEALWIAVRWHYHLAQRSGGKPRHSRAFGPTFGMAAGVRINVGKKT